MHSGTRWSTPRPDYRASGFAYGGARRPSPRRDYRASDAERERVARFLRDQFAEGRLDADELSERLEGAYGAVTVGQLRALLADLPIPPSVRGGRQVARQRLYAASAVLVLAAVMVAALASTMPGVLLALLWTAFALAVGIAWILLAAAFALGPLVVISAIVVIAVRRRRARARRSDTHPLGLP